MSLHALDAVDDAVEPTRALVARLDIGGWVKLGAVTLCVGGVGSVSFSANVPRAALDTVPRRLPALADPAEVTITVGVVAVVLAAVTGFLLVRSLLEFALYEALREEEVAVARALRRWWRHALQLWVFRAVAAWTLFGMAGVLLYRPGLGAAPVDGVGGTVATATGVALLGGYAVLSGFTTRFVVPVMVASGAGVLGAWRRFLRTAAANPGQYLAYVVVGPIVRLVADVLAISAAVLLVVLLAVPVAVFVVPAVVVATTAPQLALSPPLVLLTGGLSAGYVVAVLGGAVLARLPFVVYVRHYALAVLGGTAPSLSPVG